MTPSTPSEQTSGVSVFYVVLGSAALLSTVIFPITFMFAMRHYRRPSSPGGQLFLGDLVMGSDSRQEEPKIFDVYAEPGVQAHEPEFKYILPMAVRMASKRHVPLVNESLPSSPSTPYLPQSRDRGIDKADASVEQHGLQIQTCDIAVLILMPRPRDVDHWNELHEYVIGTVKTFVSAPTDNSTP